MMSAALKLSSTVLGRWIVQTLSCASTESPIVEPVTQWFGNGLGPQRIDLEDRRLLALGIQ
jgi:hypothetical protein